MKKLLEYFPLTKSATDLYHLIAVIVVYALAAWVIGWVLGLLQVLPLIGTILSILGWLVRLYCTCGIVLVLLKYFKVI